MLQHEAPALHLLTSYSRLVLMYPPKPFVEELLSIAPRNMVSWKQPSFYSVQGQIHQYEIERDYPHGPWR
jgi:hypothetical protein